nr:zinc ribbon domain-containing protein [Candidatus Sigynarchaeum springense]
MPLIPGIWLGACVAIAWVLSVYHSIRQPLRGNYMPRKIVKTSGIAGASFSIAMTVGLLSIVASGAAAVFRSVSLYYIITDLVIIGASWVGLYGASELRDPEAPKETRPAEDLNAPMQFKIFWRRVFSYCGRNYGAILVLMFAITVVTSVLYVFVMSSWHASLLVEEQALLTWLAQNNYTPGMTVPNDIYNRAQALYNVQNVFVVVQDVFKSSFYFAMLGICITIVMKSYTGGDSRISMLLRETRRSILPLILISIIFSTFYNILILPLLLFIPGLIFYTYCIFAFPNLLFVGKYRTLQNFGEAKNRVSGNFWRAFVYVLIIYFVPFFFQLLLQFVMDGVIQGAGGIATIKTWRMDPFGNLGNLILLEIMPGGLTILIVPLVASLIAVLFFDLAARKRAKMVASMKSPSEKARAQSLSSTTLENRTQKARYCPRCGLSVRKGITRCPNCKAEMPAAES